MAWGSRKTCQPMLKRYREFLCIARYQKKLAQGRGKTLLPKEAYVGSAELYLEKAEAILRAMEVRGCPMPKRKIRCRPL